MRLLLLSALALVAATWAADARAQVAEASVKAAFLHKFPAYVEWPPQAFAQPDSPFVIGVSGAEEVAAELERIAAGRPVLNRRVLIRRIVEGDSLRGTHMLFIGRGETGIGPLARQGRDHGVLVVTEAERGLELGASINFVTVEDRVGFEVSLDAADRAGLRISSRMLSVARRVVPRP